MITQLEEIPGGFTGYVGIGAGKARESRELARKND
jgi:ribosomal protein S5